MPNNTQPSRRAKITDENRSESSRLKSIWDSRPHRTQAEFGEHYQLGNQANVGHYLNARSALNPKAAAAFASELKCEISDFSPRIAKEIASLTQVTQASSILPSGHFGTPTAKTTLEQAVQVVADRLNTLSDSQRAQAAQRLQTLALAPDSIKARDALMTALTPALNMPSAETADFAPPVPDSVFSRKTTTAS